MKFHLYQFKIFRRLFGGNYYYINPKGISMPNFWSDIPITSCNSEIVKTETYNHKIQRRKKVCLKNSN